MKPATNRAGATRFINCCKRRKLRLQYMKPCLKLRPLKFLKTSVALWGALAFLVVVAPSSAPAQTLPIPPRQNMPWIPPSSKLPLEVTRAAEDLFKLGLADPRGGEYREITVTTGDVWGHVRQTRTHGWVLPVSGSSANSTNLNASGPRFAVCWNGLVYPVISIGAPTSVKADLLNLQTYTLRQALPEEVAVKAPPASPIGACLLLRLGDAAGAEKIWKARQRARLTDASARAASPIEELVQQWAWVFWDRALCAHLRGDDALALQSARQLAAQRRSLENLVRKARLKANDRRLFHLAFLEPLHRLLADQERRERSGRMSWATTEISKLIENLDELKVIQWGQPGGVDLTTASVAQELIAQGDEAVPYLLDVMENDNRLTRSVSFQRDFFVGRQLIGTADVAYAVLNEISGPLLGSAADLSAGSNRRAALVRQVRQHWGRRSVREQAEQQLAVLKNGKATPQQWGEAVRNLMVSVSPKDNFVPADSLRDLKSPSLSEVLGSRVELLSAIERASPLDVERRPIELLQRLQVATEMVIHFERWDARAARSVLRRLWKRVTAPRVTKLLSTVRSSTPDTARPPFEDLRIFPTRLALLRVRGGDMTALDDYALWLPTVRPSDFSSRLSALCEPLWRYPGHRSLVAVSNILFSGKPSLWNPLIDPNRAQASDEIQAIAGPLLTVPAFRAQVLRQLRGWAVCGTVEVSPAGKFTARTAHGKFEGTIPPISNTTPVATKGDFRICDFYAWQLGVIKGAPHCELYWPFERRDRVVDSVTRFLQTYGTRLKPVANNSNRVEILPARLEFTALPRPATPDDVKRGQAIFTLQGVGATRATKMKLPTRARWKNKADVLIWQVEEVSDGVRWHRYFGVVTESELRRVPSEEIQLLKGQ